MWMHIVYLATIAILLGALVLVWFAHISNGRKLIKINSLCAEMFLDEFRYNGIRVQFLALLFNERQPMMQQDITTENFDTSRAYWVSTAYQVEKSTENMLLYEARGNMKLLRGFCI